MMVCPLWVPGGDHARNQASSSSQRRMRQTAATQMYTKDGNMLLCSLAWYGMGFQGTVDVKAERPSFHQAAAEGCGEAACIWKCEQGAEA